MSIQTPLATGVVREIVLDTETTGIDPLAGHRVVEIGCVELINHVATGRTHHVYVNPERDVPPEAAAVHGLTTERLASEPVFAGVVGPLLDFLGTDALVAHNAAFDFGFLNAELRRCGLPPLATSRMVDTLALAKRRFPGASNSLDALCRRFGIDLSGRTLHGALLDARLLAEVYLELRGGRQPELLGGGPVAEGAGEGTDPGGPDTVRRRPPRPHAPTPAEAEAHAAFLARLKAPLWLELGLAGTEAAPGREG